MQSRREIYDADFNRVNVKSTESITIINILSLWYRECRKKYRTISVSWTNVTYHIAHHVWSCLPSEFGAIVTLNIIKVSINIIIKKIIIFKIVIFKLIFFYEIQKHNKTILGIFRIFYGHITQWCTVDH